MSTLNNMRKVVQELEQLTEHAKNAVSIWEWSDKETANATPPRSGINPDLTTEFATLNLERVILLKSLSTIVKKVSDASDLDISGV